MSKRTEAFFFDDRTEDCDPEISELISLEEERQARKLILIASESICPRPVRSVLSSVFTNLYAEGYPHPRLSKDERERVLDYMRQTAYLRRYSDRRYYKGTEYVDFIEALAQKRVAELFATDGDRRRKVQVPASSIFANVQSLSGAAANNAVYEAFLEPGDTVMGMSLTHGGHLTHGSPANRSGKRYNVVSYGVDPATGKLDYDRIEELALGTRPKMIIAGYSAYPWAVDWAQFARIRDRLDDCILLADIAHPAGLVAGGVYPNPVGYADVITFTTHKTLCGPRGACILTTEEERARKIDAAVFPGEQGGPHTNNIAAKAVCFEIAKTAKFKRLQRRIVRNAKYLASAFEKVGLTLAYGGTDTHVLLVDLRRILGEGGVSLTAEVATRILDICGIVANKNTIAGDDNAVYPSGVRFGTTWITQRGITEEQLSALAGLVHRVLVNIHPYEYIGSTCQVGRGKIELGIIEEVTGASREIESTLQREIRLETKRGYPHFPSGKTPAGTHRLRPLYLRLGASLARRNGVEVPLHFGSPEEETEKIVSGSVLLDRSDAGLLEVYGERASSFLQQTLTSSVSNLGEGDCQISLALDADGRLIDDLILLRLERDAAGEDHFIVVSNSHSFDLIKSWFRALSDGYVIFDRSDVYRKVEGPVVVADLKCDIPEDERLTVLSLQGPKSTQLLSALLPGTRRLKPGTSRLVRLGRRSVRVLRVDLHGESRYELLVSSLDLQALLEKWRPVLARQGSCLGGVLAEEAKGIRYGFWANRSRRSSARRLLKTHPELFDLTKTYFIGEAALPRSSRRDSSRRVYSHKTKNRPARKGWLYEEHLALGGRMIDFAGWMMPVWYKRLSDEHNAVRTSAGLFDVSHMGVVEIEGENATRFLDLVTTNYVPSLRVGQSHYSYLLYPDGQVVDDIMVYRRGLERYLVVVNAVNEHKDIEWLRAVLSRKYLIDRERTAVLVEGDPSIRNLKDKKSGDRMRIDLALQGPKSLQILQDLAPSDRLKWRLQNILRNEFAEIELSGIEVMVSRTGYTGESIGYELFVHPDRARRLWRTIIERGRKYELMPVGLGARDSTRIQAGLPLYGNELAGPHSISPIEAGYGSFVKLHKPFFVGRDSMLARTRARRMELARFRVNKRGQRLLRQGDPILSTEGEIIGAVTSSTLVGDLQQGIGFIRAEWNLESTPVFVSPGTKGRVPQRSTEAKTDRERVGATILSRFPSSSGDKSGGE